MKLVKELSGVGEVFENDTSLGNVDYLISIYQQIIKVETFGNIEKEEEGLKELIGKISSHNLPIGKNLLLVLEDGRKISFFVKNTGRDILFSSEFF